MLNIPEQYGRGCKLWPCYLHSQGHMGFHHRREVKTSYQMDLS